MPVSKEYDLESMDEKETRRLMHVLRARMSRRYTRYASLNSEGDPRAEAVLEDYRRIAAEHVVVESALGDWCVKLYGSRGPYR
jgi:hypothetical protein